MIRKCIAVFAIVTGIFGAYGRDALSEDPCNKHEPYTAVTYVVVDRTDPTTNPAALNQTLNSVEEVLKEGERIIIGVSAGAVGDTRIVMDAVKPVHTVWESAIKVRAKDKAFKECLAKARQAFSDNTEKHPKSAILETLSFVGNVLQSGTPEAKRRLVMYSDMMQNTDTLTFWGKSALMPEAALKQAEKQHLVAQLSGVDVFVAGIGSGKPPPNPQAVQEFWRQYFAKSGASLKFYGPMLLGIQ